MIPSAHVVFSPTKTGGVLVDVQTGACFELNRVGAEIWTRLVAGNSLDQIIEVIHSKYGIGPEIAAADVSRICGEMLAAGLAVRQDQGVA